MAGRKCYFVQIHNPKSGIDCYLKLYDTTYQRGIKESDAAHLGEMRKPLILAGSHEARSPLRRTEHR